MQPVLSTKFSLEEKLSSLDVLLEDAEHLFFLVSLQDSELLHRPNEGQYCRNLAGTTKTAKPELPTISSINPSL